MAVYVSSGWCSNLFFILLIITLYLCFTFGIEFKSDPCDNKCLAGSKCDVESLQCRVICGAIICRVGEVCNNDNVTCDLPVGCGGKCTAGHVCDLVSGECSVDRETPSSHSVDPLFFLFPCILVAMVISVGGLYYGRCVCLHRLANEISARLRPPKPNSYSEARIQEDPDVKIEIGNKEALIKECQRPLCAPSRGDPLDSYITSSPCGLPVPACLVMNDGGVDDDLPGTNKEEQFVQGNRVRLHRKDPARCVSDDSDPVRDKSDSRDPARDKRESRDPARGEPDSRDPACDKPDSMVIYETGERMARIQPDGNTDDSRGLSQEDQDQSSSIEREMSATHLQDISSIKDQQSVADTIESTGEDDQRSVCSTNSGKGISDSSSVDSDPSVTSTNTGSMASMGSRDSGLGKRPENETIRKQLMPLETNSNDQSLVSYPGVQCGPRPPTYGPQWREDWHAALVRYSKKQKDLEFASSSSSDSSSNSANGGDTEHKGMDAGITSPIVEVGE